MLYHHRLMPKILHIWFGIFIKIKETRKTPENENVDHAMLINLAYYRLYVCFNELSVERRRKTSFMEIKIKLNPLSVKSSTACCAVFQSAKSAILKKHFTCHIHADTCGVISEGREIRLSCHDSLYLFSEWLKLCLIIQTNLMMKSRRQENPLNYQHV